MTPYLNPVFDAAWGDADVFACANALEGEVFREVAARRTLKFSLSGRDYFIKLHRGVGWLEIVKNLATLRLPILGARNEWRAIRRLEELGVPTMTIAAFAERGLNPARRESFIVTDALVNTLSLEDFCADWARIPPAPRLKRSLIEEVAWISRRLHENGVNHRDYYICHFHIDLTVLAEEDRIRLYVIDLHRAQVRSRVPRRWRIKDVAGLLYSAIGAGLTRRDLVRFLRIYADSPVRVALRDDPGFWKAVVAKARSMYIADNGELPAELSGWLG